jgi:hypothetical protein
LKTRGVDGHSLDAVDGNPTDAVFVGPTGEIGIGTAAPQAPLHVASPVPVLALQDVDNGANGQVGLVSFRDSGLEETGWLGFGTSANPHATFMNERTGGNTALGSGGLEWVTLTPDGFVGIGTTTPSTGLHIKKEAIPPSGTLALEGLTHAYMSFYPDGVAAGRKAYLGFANAVTTDVTLQNEIPGANINLATTGGGATRVNVLEIAGADLAEKFVATDEVRPGMVVVIDPENAGQIQLARGAYNRGVAGVVSGANNFSFGAVLGNLPGLEDAPPIALSGRVYVWCDATNASIRPWDLLTTSETPGHAMRAADPARAQGAIIGKAMTGLEAGRGLVLVLVSLQ